MPDNKSTKKETTFPGTHASLSQASRPPTREDEILQSLAEYNRKITEKQNAGDPVVVLVSEDRLKASVKINPAMESERIITEEDVFKTLEETGVVFGIDKKAVTDLFLYGSFGFFVPVANGILPSGGKDARIEYRFNPARNEIKLEEDEKGNVNHHELNLVQTASKGEIIAEKVPALPGTPGKDVYGKPVPASSGADIQMVIGDNTLLGDDGVSVISAISGQPILRDGVIFVSPVYEVAGDVDFGIGNIDFDGSVLVHGNVLSDFIVRATDDIQINGNVEKASIEAGGNVLVNRGLYGLGEGRIVAGDSVTIRFVESGIVEADRNITVTQAARHSTLMAGENLVQSHPRGSIIGGRLACGRDCDVIELGSTSFTETIVEIGMGPKTMKIRRELEESVRSDREKRDKLYLNIKILMKQKEETGFLEGDKEELLKKIVPAYHRLNALIEENTSKLKFLVDKINTMPTGRCRIRETAHPGVKIITPNASTVLKKEYHYCSFYERKDEITMGPY